MKTARRRLLGTLALCVLSAAFALAAMIVRPAPAGNASTVLAPGGLTWVYALYVDADDSLDYAWAKYSVRFLSHLGGSSQVRVVALIDRRGNGGVTLAQFGVGGMRVVARLPEKDVGAAATLRWFISQVHRRYPSQHLALSIWDHGYAWRGFSYDQSSGHEISLPGLASAIRDAAVPIDVLAFDACNMADAGVVYQAGATGLVHYVVASEQAINEAGFPYDRFLEPLLADPGRSPVQLAASIVTAYGDYYHGRAAGARASLSAVDARALVGARADIARWAGDLLGGLGAMRQTYAAALRAGQRADVGDEVDLGDLLRRLIAQPGTAARLRVDSMRLLADVTGSVSALRRGPRVAGLTGLTLWWPSEGGWNAEAAAYRQDVPLAAATGWAAFLGHYEK